MLLLGSQWCGPCNPPLGGEDISHGFLQVQEHQPCRYMHEDMAMGLYLLASPKSPFLYRRVIRVSVHDCGIVPVAHTAQMCPISTAHTRGATLGDAGGHGPFLLILSLGCSSRRETHPMLGAHGDGGALSEGLPQECRSAFWVPRGVPNKNTRQCHEGQRMLFRPIESVHCDKDRKLPKVQLQTKVEKKRFNQWNSYKGA